MYIRNYSGLQRLKQQCRMWGPCFSRVVSASQTRGFCVSISLSSMIVNRLRNGNHVHVKRTYVGFQSQLYMSRLVRYHSMKTDVYQAKKSELVGDSLECDAFKEALLDIEQYEQIEKSKLHSENEQKSSGEKEVTSDASTKKPLKPGDCAANVSEAVAKGKKKGPERKAPPKGKKGPESKAPPKGKKEGPERKAPPKGKKGPESKAPPKGKKEGPESKAPPKGKKKGPESKAPPKGVNVTKEQEKVRPLDKHPFQPREVMMNYKNIKQYSRRMATLLYLEEELTLGSDQSMQFTSEDFVLHRYSQPELVSKGFFLDLKITPLLQRRFFKLTQAASEDQKTDESNPDLGGQNVFLIVDNKQLWTGYVTLLPREEKKRQKSEVGSTDTITVAVNFYKWGYQPLPKNIKNMDVKVMFVSAEVNRMLRAISRLPGSSFPSMVLGKANIEYSRSKPLVKLSDKKFNDSQKIAVRSVLKHPITVIQGPPGTGKTSTIHEMILQLLEKELFPIVVVAASNVAVDNIAEKMMKTHRDSLLRLTAFGKEAEYEGDHHLASICLHNKFYDASSPEVQTAIQKLRAGIRNASPEELTSFRNAKKRFLRAQLSTQKVIFTTTSAAATLLVGPSPQFPVVIMDEATQSSEPASLIPLTLPGVKKIVLVGDQKQLSSTTNIKGLSLSLFERVIRNGTFKSHEMLDTQYRMHPAISRFPRERFYAGQLKDGVTAAERTLPGLPKNPVLFWDTCGNSPEETVYVENRDGGENHSSKSNPKEARAVELILTYLIEKKGIKRSSIGVITPYRGQRNEICSVLMKNRIINPMNEDARVEIDGNEFSDTSERSTVQIISGIMLASIDAFQGRERDFIIMSFVRSNPENSIGFLGDMRRLNVGLTRAKYGLIIVGDLECLRNGSKLWKAYARFLEDTKSVHRGLNFTYD